ncbi:MAG: hypothetical protein HY664_03565, partial [Chloroflexi bacterium]|nr:hypothetical protein [Chloroflexota bacterium]
MATATIAQIRKAYPQARVTVAVGPWSREVLTHNPHIDQLLNCASVGSGRVSPYHYLNLIKRIRQGGFDTAIVLDRSPLLNLIPFWAGIPRRVGLDSQGRGFALTIKVPIRPQRHEAELYLDTVRALGIVPQKPRLEFLPTPEEASWAAAQLKAIRKEKEGAI